jgi:adhesin HecA-like repeat protein
MGGMLTNTGGMLTNTGGMLTNTGGMLTNTGGMLTNTGGFPDAKRPQPRIGGNGGSAMVNPGV